MRQVLTRVLSTCLVFFAAAVCGSRAQDANGNGIVDRLELPGTQPAASLPGPDYALDQALNPSTDCQSCHTTLSAAGPFPAWAGTMMANASRDPVFWAQLDVAEADEAANPSIAGARDVCLRCHMGKGWLEGRSSGPVLATALRGMEMQENDLLGVQCALCHRMVDPASADAIDSNMLTGLNSNPDVELRVPPTYGNGQYVIDRYDVRRGPYNSTQIGWVDLVSQFIAVWPPPAANTHSVKLSAFHRSGKLCGTCHDVSNPIWTPAEARGNVQANFPIERTFTEWANSAYAAQGEDGSCQSCHMNGVLNNVLAGGVSGQSEDPTEPYRHLNDVHFHDLTGGNVWLPKLISAMVDKFQATKSSPDPGASPAIGTTQAQRDSFLDTSFAWVVKQLYPAGTYARVGGLQPPPLGYLSTSYDAVSARAQATLERAAQLSGSRLPGGDLKVRVWNMTGHKLPTGYPEGRRMWLDVKFLAVNPANGNETLLAQSGEYDPATGTLYHDFDLSNAAGPKPYDVATYTDGGGGVLGIGRRTQVYEARLRNSPSGTEFHFILNNQRVSDNRIPPLGWIKAQYQTNHADQVIPAAYTGSQMQYQDSGVPGETTYNFDEQTYPVPAGADVAEVTLWYQSVSREYVEELQAASPRTLTYPATGTSTFSRGDLLEYLWRTVSLGGQSRIPPVQMTKLRIALVDTDGDGLPDNWETANGLDPNSGDGINGRNGDPDSDGRSNWSEFQAKTPANSADASRTPLDLALVLDFSGSMNDPAPAGTNSKIDALKDAVDLFLKTWKQYAVKDDRLAIVYFSTGATIEGGSIVDFNALGPGVTVESTIDSLIAAVRARSASGNTALGGGLETALHQLTTGGVGHRKQIIVFTNGMQNQSPMVRKNMANQYVVQAEAVNFGNGVYGDSGVTDAGGPAFGTALAGLNIPIHTIGIGVSETPDDRWETLLSELSANTGGLNQFISRGFEIEGAFMNNLVQALRGFSPQLVKSYVTSLGPAEQTKSLTFQMDAIATKASFVLSWAGASLPGRLRFELIGPDGATLTTPVRIIDGRNYQLAECFFPMATGNGRPIAHAGTWTMVIRREDLQQRPGVSAAAAAGWRTPAEFRAYLIAEIPDTNFDVRFSRRVFRAGDEAYLFVRMADAQNPVLTLDKITAEISRPSAALGSLLSRASFRPGVLQAATGRNGDRFADPAAAKAWLLLTDAKEAARLAPSRYTVQLYDDGKPEHGDAIAHDGVFTARLGKLAYPGLVSANVEVTGVTARSRAFTRRFPVNAVILNAPFAADRSRIRITRVDAARVQVVARPTDRLGNLLGPGFRDRVSITLTGAAPESDVIDNLDGSYSREFYSAGAPAGTVAVAVDSQPFYSGPASSLNAGGHLLWLLLILALAMMIWLATQLWSLLHNPPA